MVGTAPPPATALQQQASAPAASSSSTGSAAAAAAAATTAAATLSSAEEEAYKRNTDCVYFLASPLTCKKGSECEYRHSDVARVNPRDCWYWMHGNCLNPKCAFRHPPLDGLLGTQVPNAMGASMPPSHNATTAAAPAPYAAGKQAVPCIFFQKGLCLKGDWCQFSHGPNSVNNKVLQSQAATTATELPNFKQTFVGHEKFTAEKKVLQTNFPKSFQLPQTKTMTKFESAPAKSEIPIKKTAPPASTIDDELHRYRPADISSVENENQVSWSNRVQQPVSLNDHNSINGKDMEEFSREPSPGFDVLVDNELRDSDYYNSEDQFGRTGDHEGRNEYYDGRSGDYGSMLDADRDIYHESRGYDSYERQGHYAWEQHGSSERMSGGSALPERRQYSKAESPDQVAGSDLRHRLSKHRRANGLRSVINQDYARERRLDDRGYQNLQRPPRNDSERQENTLSSRLSGRIKIPVQSFSSADGNGLHQDREIERRRDYSGLSQGRLQVPSRLRDRIKGNVEEDINNEGRNNRGLRIRRDIIADNNANFAGPKSLAELRGRKNIDSNEQHVDDRQSLTKRKYSNLESQQLTGGELSFDGPKPLEEILKRKRGSGTAVSGSGTTSGDNDDYTSKKEERSMKTKAGAETGIGHSSTSKNDLDLPSRAYNSPPSVKSRTETAPSYDGPSSHPHDANEAEVEEGMIVDDGAEDQEPENCDHRDEESDYEQGDGEDYNLDVGDNGDPEEEYLDDDDDFAKKMGVMY